MMKEFKEYMAKTLEEIMGMLEEGETLNQKEIQKVGHRDPLHQVWIETEGCRAYPVFYLEDGYEIGMDGKDIYESLKEHKVENGYKFEMNLARVRKEAYFRMAGAWKNRKAMKDYMTYKIDAIEDIVFYAVIDETINGKVGTIALKKTDPMFEQLKPEEYYDLIEAIKQNTRSRLTEEPLADALSRMTGDDLSSFESPFIIVKGPRSEAGLLAEFKVQEDCWIIPSSKHEILLLPVSYESNAVRLREMIREVNNECLDEVDILSNKLYFYCTECKCVSTYM